MNDKIRGMKDAVQMVERCQLYNTGGLSPHNAAVAMKEVILGCLRAHIRAAEQTALDESIKE